MELNAIQIRRANGEDSFKITQLRHRSWLRAYAKESIASKKEIDKQFYEQLNSSSQMLELEKYFNSDVHNCFVAEKNKKILGVVWLNDNIQNQEMPQVCRMWGLYIEPKFQNQHLGTKLWNFAISYAKAKGYKKLELDTPLDNQNATIFYEKKGCKKTLIYKDELVKGRKIDFVEYEVEL